MVKPQMWLSLLKGCIQVVLFLGSLIRYNFFSLVYLLFLLASPLVPFRKLKPFLAYNISLIVCSSLFTLAQSVFQIVLAANPPYGSLVSDCSLDSILRQIGLQSYDNTPAHHLLRLLLPEPLILAVSLASVCIGWRCRHNLFHYADAAPPSPQPSLAIDAASNNAPLASEDHYTVAMGLRYLRSMLLHFLLLCLLCSCAVCSPSVATSVYMVAFLLAVLVWSIAGPGPDSLPIERGRQCLALYAGLHLVALFCYQLPVVHGIQGVEPNSTAARMMGLYYMIQSNCSTNEVYFNRQIRVNEYVEPILLISFYFFACLVMYLWKTDPFRQRRRVCELTIQVPTPDTVDQSYLLGQSESTPLYQSTEAAAGAVNRQLSSSSAAPGPSQLPALSEACEPPGGGSEQPLGEMPEQQELQQQQQQQQELQHNRKPSRLVQAISQVGVPLLSRGIARIRAFLMSLSHVLALIIMMCWSVTYVSLATAPFLLIACILWLLPSTRRSTLTLSPLLALYGTGLLLTNFVFNFDLADIYFANLNARVLDQAGLQRYDQPLATFGTQAAFCFAFFIGVWTLLAERRLGSSASATAAAAAAAAAAAVSSSSAAVAAAPSGASACSSGSTSSLRMRRFGAPSRSGGSGRRVETLLAELMSKYSVVVCCVFWLLMCSWLEVNVNRVIVMAMFLYFIFTFRVSFSFWKRQLLVIFIVLVLYSMLVLLLIYAYQFDSVPQFITKLTGLQKAVLKDIGIETYATPQLFLNLLFPTSFIIVIMIYAKNFHATFLRLISLRARDSTDNAALDRDDDDDDEEEVEGEVRQEAGNDAGGVVGGDDEAGVGRAAVGSTASGNLATGKSANRHLGINALLLRFNRFYNAYSNKFSPTVWRLMELHWYKIVGLVIVCVSATPMEGTNFDASSLIYAGLVPLYLLAPQPVSIVYLAWSSLLILAKMIYQLNLVREPLQRFVDSNCSQNATQPDPQSNATNLPSGSWADNFRYFGLYVPNLPSTQSGPGGSLFSHLMLHASVTVCLAVQHIVRLKQRQKRLLNGEAANPPRHRLVFPEFTFIEFESFYCERISSASGGVRPLVGALGGNNHRGVLTTGWQFFANFFGYKLGLELACVAIVISAGLRLDVISCVYLLFLLLFNFLRRDTIKQLWPLFHLVVGLGFSLQFCLACGFPPFLCLNYPWFSPATRALFSDNARQWLFLPAYGVPPRAEKLIVDYFLLLAITCQRHVFSVENTPNAPGYVNSNSPIWKDVASELKLRCSFLDVKISEPVSMLFKLIFVWLFWLCLFVLLLLGFLSFNLLSFFYILAAFYLFAKGHQFLLQDRTRLVRIWSLVIGLNVFSLLCKCGLQLIGCSNNIQLSDWSTQLFGIQCLNMHVFKDYTTPTTSDGELASVNNPGIVMDMVCFVLLILQKRVFLTKYFTEVRLDTEIQNSFTSKGARIITITLRRIMEANQREERNEIAYVRRKVQHLQSRKRQKRELTDHFQVVRSGTKDLFYTVDQHGNKVLSIEEPSDIDESDPQMQPSTAETLFEQGVLKANEFAQKPSQVFRKTIGNLSRRQSRSYSMTEDEAYRRISAENRPPSSVASSDEFQASGGGGGGGAASSAGHSHYNNRMPIPEEEDSSETLAVEAGDGQTEKSGNKIAQPDQVKITVSEWPPIDPEASSHAAIAEVAPPDADLLESLSVLRPATEPARPILEVSDEQAPKKKAPCCRALLHLVELVCEKLDYQTADYRNIKEQMMASQLEAKADRLAEAEPLLHDDIDSAASGRQVKLRIRNFPEELISPSGRDGARELETVQPLPPTEGWSQALSRLALLLQYLVLSRLTPICYIAMVTYYLVKFTLFALYYPLVVFLWGMMSSPYPTKRFWFASMTYTMFLILFKYSLTFSPISKLLLNSEDLFAKWLSFEAKASESTPVAELCLLALLFVQRSNLKRYGLWNISRRNLQPGNEANQSADSETAMNAEEPSSSSATAAVAAPEASVVRKRKTASSQLDAKAVDPCGDAPSAAAGDQANVDPVADASTFPKPADASTGAASTSTAPNSFLWNCLTLHPFREFYKKVAVGSVSVKVDLYSSMFAFEFLSLLIIFFGYTSGFADSGTSDDVNILTYFSKEEIPLTLTLTLFVQFFLMLLDRGLFLTKSRSGKYFFHILHVILLHVYLKFVLPAMSSPEYISESLVIKLFYASKCIYFALSASQILSGYPSRVLGNFLCKGHNYLNLFSFKLYMLVPFLFELRSIMDWMLSNTALSVSHWLLMEDMHSLIFVSKCWRRAEIAYPTERAKNRPPCYKYCPGVWLIILIVACIWAPLLWFSVMSSVFLETNAVTSCTSELSLSAYTPLYTLKTTTVLPFSPSETEAVRVCFSGGSNSSSYAKRINSLLSSTTAYTVQFKGMSSVLWTITPPARAALTEELAGNATVPLTFRLECLREKDAGVSKKTDFTEYLAQGSDMRTELLHVLQNSTASPWVIFRSIGSRFLLLRGDSSEISKLTGLPPEAEKLRTPISLQAKLNASGQASDISWWQLSDLYSGDYLCPGNYSNPPAEGEAHNSLRLVLLSQRARSENRLIQAIQKVGMYGILSVFLISIARILRSGIVPVHYLVAYVEMPHVDRILAIMKDIYLVRETGDLQLEEELFAKLLYLFRSPSMLLRYSQTPEHILAQFYRPVDDVSDGDNPDGDGQQDPAAVRAKAD